MKLRSMLILVALALVGGACGASPDTGGPTVARTLAYSLTGDQVLTYHADIESNMNTDFGDTFASIDSSMPSTMKTQLEMAMDLTYQIGDGPTPGSYRVAMTVGNMEMGSGSVEMGGERVDLSGISQSEIDAALRSQMPEFVYIINEKGEIVSVELDGIGIDVQGLLGGTSGGVMNGGQMFGPELPEGEVNVGDTWTTTSQQEFGDNIVVTEVTHKIMRREGHSGVDTWLIKSEARTDAYTITWEDMTAMLEAMGGIGQVPGMEDVPASFQMAMRSSPSVTTTYTWLDPEQGMAIGVDTSGSTAMTVEMGGIPGMVGIFSLDIDGSTHVVMELDL
jgi:hypothetical protein